MIKKLKQWYYITKCIWRGDPVRSWRKLDNGKYFCDGDCGRFSLHGVCTCGLAHYFKGIEGGYDMIERDDVSWRREGHTEEVMMGIDYIKECDHGVHLNTTCDQCKLDVEASLKELFGIEAARESYVGKRDIVLPKTEQTGD